jgi:hypothetical protein
MSRLSKFLRSSTVIVEDPILKIINRNYLGMRGYLMPFSFFGVFSFLFCSLLTYFPYVLFLLSTFSLFPLVFHFNYWGRCFVRTILFFHFLVFSEARRYTAYQWDWSIILISIALSSIFLFNTLPRLLVMCAGA